MLLIGIYTPFYLSSLDWRRVYGQQHVHYDLLAVQGDLFGRSNLERFAAEHLDQFFFVRTPHTVAATTGAIRVLHDEGIAPYRLLVDE